MWYLIFMLIMLSISAIAQQILECGWPMAVSIGFTHGVFWTIIFYLKRSGTKSQHNYKINLLMVVIVSIPMFVAIPSMENIDQTLATSLKFLILGTGLASVMLGIVAANRQALNKD